MEIINKPVYVSDDGREFTTESDCEAWEAKLKLLTDNLRYFVVLHDADLTEGRGFQSTSKFGVLRDANDNVSSEQLLLSYCWETYGPLVRNWYCDRAVQCWNYKEVNEVIFNNTVQATYGSRRKAVAEQYLMWSYNEKKVVAVSKSEIFNY